MRSTLSMMVLAGTLGLMMCGETQAQRLLFGNRGSGSNGPRPNAYPGYNAGNNFGSNNFGGYRGGFGNGITLGNTLGTVLGYGNQGQYDNNGNQYYYPSTPSYGYSYPSQGTTYYTTPGVVYSTPGVIYSPSTSGPVIQSTPTYDTTTMPSTIPSTMPSSVTTGKAIIDVTVPTADARVLFGNTLMDKEGTERRYESTEIALGQNFTYNITAQWMNDGKLMEQVQKVDVMAGKTSKVVFRNKDATRRVPAPEPSRKK